jgi:hypothetical protein
MRSGVAVVAGDLDGDRLGRRHIAVDNRHLRAGGSERAAGRSADPVATAGNKSDLSNEILRHLFNSITVTPAPTDRILSSIWGDQHDAREIAAVAGGIPRHQSSPIRVVGN